MRNIRKPLCFMITLVLLITMVVSACSGEKRDTSQNSQSQTTTDNSQTASTKEETKPAEKIELTDEEYAEKIVEYLEYYGYVDDQAGFEKAYDKELIKKSMLYNKVAEALLQWGVPTEA